VYLKYIVKLTEAKIL